MFLQLPFFGIKIGLFARILIQVLKHNLGGKKALRDDFLTPMITCNTKEKLRGEKEKKKNLKKVG